MVTAPLNELLNKNAADTFELNKERLAAFRKLEDAVLSPAVLSLPGSGLAYIVDTDASNYGIGCALFQTHSDGERKPINFSSRSLNEVESNYLTPER